MRTSSLLTACLLSTLLGTGCGSKQKTSAGETGGSATASRQGASTKTSTAKGDMRAALLHLRRVHFPFDNHSLGPEARAALEEAALRLKAHPDVHIYIDGHTDGRGTSEYNVALGEKRAEVVSDYLVRMGIAPGRLHSISFGKENLWVPGGSAVANAKNRRVEFRLLRGQIELVLEEGTLYDDAGHSLSARN